MFEMVRDANVEVQAVETKKGLAAYITVNDKYEHQFSPKSRISQQLQLILPKELGERMTGGDYFFVDDNLVDFRDQRYSGFVHSDDAIDNLMNVIGYTELESRHQRALHRMTNRTQTSELSLSKQWSTQGIEVPAFDEGGRFSSNLNFTWNPFTKNVNSVFELVRLICTNGMVGTTPFVNLNIPLVNRWEEHLDIANMQLQNKISSMMASRLKEMSNSRASVADLALLTRHIAGRLESKEEGQNNVALHKMFKIVDIYGHLSKFYQPDALENNAIAAQLPSHLSTFDTWNMATELCTHYSPASHSSDAGLQKLANDLVFRRDCTTTRVASIGKRIEESPFSSPARAFFGDVELVM
jgi:hypothetical protein